MIVGAETFGFASAIPDIPPSIGRHYNAFPHDLQAFLEGFFS